MTVRIEWDGLDEFERKLTKLAVGAGAVMGPLLFMEGQKVIAKSVPQTPFRDGFLRGSATVGQPRVSGSGAEVDVGFGGAAEAYAVVQHENQNFAHPIGKAKFLEDPLNEHMGEFARNLGDGIMAWAGSV